MISQYNFILKQLSLYNFLEFSILKEIIIFIELFIFNLFHGHEKNDHVRKISISYSFNFVTFYFPIFYFFFSFSFPFIVLFLFFIFIFFLFNIFHLFFSFLFFIFIFIFHILKEKFGSIKIRLFVLGNCEKFFFAIIIFWNVLLTELF